MSWLNEHQRRELLREAARRGGARARELAEHARERYGSGPDARHVTPTGQAFYFEGTFSEHHSTRQALGAFERRTKR